MLDCWTELSAFKLRSVTPGRIRWRVPALVDQPEMGHRVCEALAGLPPVISVKVNARTGSVLVLHSPACVAATLTTALEAVLVRLAAERKTRAVAPSQVTV